MCGPGSQGWGLQTQVCRRVDWASALGPAAHALFLIFHFCRFLNMLSGDGRGSFLVVANKHGDQKPRFHLDVVALPLFSSGLLLERFVL